MCVYVGEHELHGSKHGRSMTSHLVTLDKRPGVDSIHNDGVAGNAIWGDDLVRDGELGLGTERHRCARDTGRQSEKRKETRKSDEGVWHAAEETDSADGVEKKMKVRKTSASHNTPLYAAGGVANGHAKCSDA